MTSTLGIFVQTKEGTCSALNKNLILYSGIFYCLEPDKCFCGVTYLLSLCSSWQLESWLVWDGLVCCASEKINK